MMKYYKIAGLIVAMDSHGRVDLQAEPYRIESCSDIDLTINPDYERFYAKFPNADDDLCEYLTTGADFYKKLLSYDGFQLHSSCIVVDDRAYLFSANSGTGKSTHTNLWLKLFGDRAFILNDDKPALRLEDGVWYAYGTPWSGKHDISVNTRVPVGGIACLERGEVNEIEPFGGYDAVLAILRQSNKPKDAQCRMQLLELLDKLISQVPVWKLRCNMEPEAAIVSYEAMSGKKWRE